MAQAPSACSPAADRSEFVQPLQLVGQRSLRTLALQACAGEVISALLEMGADANAWDCNGATPVYAACHYKQPAVLAALLAGGTSPTADVSQFPVTDEAADYGLLGERGTLPHMPLHAACGPGPRSAPPAPAAAAACVHALLEGGAEAQLEAADGANGWTPLMQAAYFGLGEAVSALLEAGAQVDA